jgi:hypothetical protein
MCVDFDQRAPNYLKFKHIHSPFDRSVRHVLSLSPDDAHIGFIPDTRPVAPRRPKKEYQLFQTTGRYAITMYWHILCSLWGRV